MPGADNLIIEARTALLDAVAALEAHKDSVILIGAQAIYLHTGRRMVFNVAALNRDDHTKNFAFLLPERDTWRLSPAYDVTHAYNPRGEWTQHHQMAINGKFDDITLADLYAVADAQGVAAYKSVTREVLDAVSTWPERAAEAGVDQRSIDEIGRQIHDHDPRND